MSRRSRMGKARRSASGFTLIEVMTSIGVMIIGAFALIGLQQQTVLMNSAARQKSTANQIAQTWIERLKQDGHLWTQVPDLTMGIDENAVIGNTRWLRQVNAAANVFQPLQNLNVDASNAFDYRGNEIAPVVGGVVGGGAPWFCVSFRPAWVYPGRALRVDVRVFWPRPRSGAVVIDCAEDNVSLSPGGAREAMFATTYLSTVITHSLVTR